MESKRWIWVVILVLFLCLLFLLLGRLPPWLERSTSTDSGPATSPVVVGPPPSPDQYAPSPDFWGSPQSTLSVASAPRASSKVVSEEMLAIAQEARDFREEGKKESDEWFAGFLENPEIATDTKETYRMRALANMPAAVLAFESKDYQAALRELKKALEDPAASPTTKYYCYDYMREAAARLQDEDAYIEYSMAQAMLLKDNDFSHMGFDETDAETSIEWVRDAALQLKAIKDQTVFNSYVDEVMRKWQVPADKRPLVEADVKEQINALRKRIFG